MPDSSRGERSQYDIDFTSDEDIFDILASEEELEEEGVYIAGEPEEDLRYTPVEGVGINIGEEVPDHFPVLDDGPGGGVDVRTEAVDESDPLLSLEDELENQAGSGVRDELKEEMTDHDGDVETSSQFSAPPGDELESHFEYRQQALEEDPALYGELVDTPEQIAPPGDELESHFEYRQQALEEDPALYSELVDTPEQIASRDDELESHFDSSPEGSLAEGRDVDPEHISETDQFVSANDNAESLAEYSPVDTSEEETGNLAASSSAVAGVALAAEPGKENAMELTMERKMEDRREVGSAGDTGSGESVTPLTRLKELVLSIDWEISNDVLSEFTRELNRLKGIWAGEKVNLIYVQAMEKLVRYVYVEKGDAHPGALQLLSHLYGNLERVISSTTLGEAEKKELLKNDVSRFALLKEQIKEGVVGSSSFSNEREDERKESPPGAAAAAGSVVAGGVSAASGPAAVKREAAAVDSAMKEEESSAPAPAAVEEGFPAADFAMIEEESSAPAPAAVEEGFTAADFAMTEEEPSAPAPAAVEEGFPAADFAMTEEEPSAPAPAAVEEGFTAADFAMIEEEPSAPASAAVEEGFTAADFAMIEGEPSAPAPAAVEEGSPAVNFATAEDAPAAPEPVGAAEDLPAVDFSALSLERSSDKAGQQSAPELEDDNFASLQGEDENDRESSARDGDEIELSDQQSSVLSAAGREDSSLEKRFSFLSDEEALRGVDVDMEADDDMGEEELPRENGELAPALADVFAESAVVDVDSEVEETVSRFFSEEECVAGKTLPDKEHDRGKRGFFASGAAALTVFAGSMWKKKAVSKREMPLTAEQAPVDSGEEPAAVQFSSLDNEGEKDSYDAGAVSDYREEELVAAEADTVDWPPLDDAVVVSDDIFMDIEESSSAVEAEDDEYVFVLGEEDDDTAPQRPEESLLADEPEQIVVEEGTAEAVAGQLRETDNDINALSSSVSGENISEEESAVEFDLDFLPEEMAGAIATGAVREEAVDDDPDIVTVSSLSEELTAEGIDEDWLVLDSTEEAELVADFEEEGAFSLESEHLPVAPGMAEESEQRELVIEETEESDELSTLSVPQAISPEDVAMLVGYCQKLQQEKDKELLAEMMMMHNRLVEEMEGHPLELHFLLLFAAVADYLEFHDEEAPLQLMVSVASTLQVVLKEDDPLMAQKLLLRESARVLDWFGGLVE